jgi:hypothetical protein
MEEYRKWYAQLDENNTVINVIDVIDPTYIDSVEGIYVETDLYTRLGIHYSDWDCHVPSLDQSKALRKNFATIDGTYNPEYDCFVPYHDKERFKSWEFNPKTGAYEAPLPKPKNSKEISWEWDEDLQRWRPYSFEHGDYIDE